MTLVRAALALALLWPAAHGRPWASETARRAAQPPAPAPGAGPAPAGAPAAVLRGTATWYAYVPGGAAAGPALRRALGPGWRNRTVTVCAGGRCVRARLSDWCRCPGGRAVDLDVRSFARLAPPSRGVLPVTVSW